MKVASRQNININNNINININSNNNNNNNNYAIQFQYIHKFKISDPEAQQQFVASTGPTAATTTTTDLQTTSNKTIVRFATVEVLSLSTKSRTMNKNCAERLS